jgi:hypothetical protein
LRTPDGRTRRQAIIADREDGYLSLCWRSRMRELEKMPIGIPLPDPTMDQFMDLEDGWSTREGRGLTKSRLCSAPMLRGPGGEARKWPGRPF